MTDEDEFGWCTDEAVNEQCDVAISDEVVNNGRAPADTVSLYNALIRAIYE